MSEAQLFCVPVVQKGSHVTVWAGVVLPDGGEPSDVVVYGTAPSQLIPQVSSMSYYGSGEASTETDVPAQVLDMLAGKGDQAILRGASRPTVIPIKKGRYTIVARGGRADMSQLITNAQPQPGDRVTFPLNQESVSYSVSGSLKANVWEAKPI